MLMQKFFSIVKEISKMERTMKLVMMLMCVVAFTAFSSCSNRIFPKETLEMNYTVRMTSQHQREMKAKVRIFYSENEVKEQFNVISVNRYSPWFSIPIIYSYDKQMERKYLKNAVETAYDQGANGIIIMSPKYYKAIVINSWDSDKEQAVEQKSIVFDTSLSTKFSSGEIHKMKPRNIKQYIKSFNEELNINARYVTTSDELKFFIYKLNLLDDYYKEKQITDKDASNKLEKYKLIAYKRFCDEISRSIKNATTSNELAIASEMVKTLEEQYKVYPLKKDVITSKIKKLQEKIEKTRKKIKG